MKSMRLTVWIALLLFVTALGAYGIYVYLTRTEGEPVAWALLVPSYVFFALAATGSSLVNSIYSVFRVQRFRRIIKRGIWLSLVLVVPAWLFILTDLGRWFQAYNIYVLFNPTSRMAWMGALYILFGVFLLLELIVVIREDLFPGWVPLAVGIVVLLVTLGVHTNLGALFGAVWSRPLWSSHLLALQFIISAVLVGAALHILFMTVVQKVTRGRVPDKLRGLFSRDYTPLMILLILGSWILIAIEFLPGLFSPEEAPFVQLLLAGRYAALFWLVEIVIGGVVPLILLVYPRTRSSAAWLVLASALVAIGVYFSKYNLLIGGQVIVEGPPSLGEAFISYAPDVAGILILLGGTALCLLVYTVGELLLPLEPEEEPVRFVFGKKRVTAETG